MKQKSGGKGKVEEKR